MPDGLRLRDGFPTTVTFAQAANFAMWENEVQPPGVDSGGPNDTTSMRNILWRTNAAKKLRTLTPMTGDAQYDPQVITDVLNQLANNQQISTNYSNGAKLNFYGFLDKWMPQKIKEGSPPLSDFTIQPSNIDLTGAESSPTYVAPGTTTTVTTTTL